MIHYKEFTLENGLQVYVHEDSTTPMAVVNIVYNVGSRDEHPDKTGFAHLFEHLMFGGSVNIPSYDQPLQQVGAENNAFTSPDITNYYITLPSVNLETAFWLESDRMMSLSFDPKVLEVQRSVVIEEFKQRYLNQPYGDIWMKLRPLAYSRHPYQWATIGKEVSHIEQATMQDVKDFFFTFYNPSNAILVVAGNVKTEEVEQLARKWFGSIPAGKRHLANRPIEPPQTAARTMHTTAAVPSEAIYKAYHMVGRYDAGYYASDLLSDILGRGKSSRLYTKLVQEQPVFSQISAYVTSSLEPGLLVISGHAAAGVSLEEANSAIEEVVADICAAPLPDKEVEKVKNQALTSLAFSEVDLINRAMSIAFAANAGNVAWCNEDTEQIKAVTPASIWEAAKNVLHPTNCSTLFYHKS